MKEISLIVGAGEIGHALLEVLSPYYITRIKDVEPLVIDGQVSVMHICFPYSENFIEQVKQYQEEYKPKFTVIHSTVPVGTSRKCNACHSSIRGNHPFLAQSIRTFKKIIAGEGADEVAEYFRRANIKVQVFRQAESDELGKIADTTFYAVCIEFIKELERMCKKHKVPFSEAFTISQQIYNEGWKDLGYPEYSRPILQPLQRKQGGHCTLPNLEFYKGSKFVKLIKSLNK